MPNVILITIDTLRYDAINKHITPNIWEWSKDKLVFSNCYAQSSWTRASYASLFTGLYSYQHKCLRNALTLTEMNNNQMAYDTSIDKSIKTMPEILQENNFYTIAIQGNPTIAHPISKEAYGFDRGFDEYISPIRTYPWKFYPEAVSIKEHAISNLDRLKNNKFFMWINFMDPHCPYFPPQEYSPCIPKNKSYLNLKEDLDYQLTDNDKKLIYGNYLKEIRYVDNEFKRVLEYIPDDTIIILTSDHGEEFWEHGNNRSDNNFYGRGVDHGHTLYDEMIHVPMIIAHPELIASPLRELQEINTDSLIQQKSFFKMILEQFLDIDTGDKYIVETDFIFSEALLYGPERKAFIFQDGYKAIISQSEEEIYDIKKNEHIQIGNEKVRTEVLDRIEEADIEIDWFQDVDSITEPQSEQVIERLKGLGYL